MALKVVKYTDLIPRMMRDITNYSLATTVFALQDAGREFCNRSEAWFVDLDPIDVVANQQEYTLDPTLIAQIKKVDSVNLLSSDDVASGYLGTRVHASRYRLILPNTLRFDDNYIPTTPVTSGMVVRVTLAPTMGTNELPEWLMARWAEGIIGHAMYTLLRKTDPNTAVVYLNQFNAKLGEAMAESLEDIHP
ncbi:MAG: hypothetical protein WCI95_03155 [bacterium]